MKAHLISLIVVFSALQCTSALDHSKCLSRLNSGQLRSQTHDNRSLGLDSFGKHSEDADATAISYLDCISLCPGGSKPVPFKWSKFTQQSAAWLFPWLALISQLPFGAESRRNNALSMVLAVGSPTLAAYSLALTTLSSSYIASRLLEIRHPNAYQAVRVLIGLHQVSLGNVADNGLLLSLARDDECWRKWASLVEHDYEWTLSALTAIAWVIVAYLLTVVDAFSLIGDENIRSDGPAVGSLWVWLLPIVIGWHIASPQKDVSSLRNTFYDTASTIKDHIEILNASDLNPAGSRRSYHVFLCDDISSTPPIFNYSRIFDWNTCVEQLADAFCAANLDNTHSVEQTYSQDPNKPQTRHPKSRGWGIQQLGRKIVLLREYDGHRRQTQKMSSRMAVAAMMALMLQWCTVGAAVFIASRSTRAGIGCRSLSYLLYATGSTVVWFTMVLSAIFRQQSARGSRSFRRRLRHLSAISNAFGKALAGLNTCWVVCICFLQFANVYNSCFCNSGILLRGVPNAFILLTFTEEDRHLMKKIWIVGVAISLASAAMFVAFVWLHQRRVGRCNNTNSVLTINVSRNT